MLVGNVQTKVRVVLQQLLLDLCRTELRRSSTDPTVLVDDTNLRTCSSREMMSHNGRCR